jgi:signal transduction histidine kinase
MSADTAPTSRPHRLNRLWGLAAILGIAATYLTMSIFHDSSRQHEAVGIIAQSIADQMASRLVLRTDLLAARGAERGTNSTFMRDSIFDPCMRELAQTNARLVELDSGSVQLTNGDSSITIGELHEAHHYRASAPGGGALAGWRVTVALQHRSISSAVLPPVPDGRLWLVGVLGVLAVAVLIVGIGASQRELLLARARSDFMAGVSHELRMPLAQILLAGETLALQRERSDAERTGLSRSIVREARRLTGIVDNVLFFSRSDSGRPQVHMQAVQVGALFDNVIESVELALADAGQSITISAGAELRVLADADVMRHAIVNVVDNAIKYGKATQRIVLSAERSGDNRVLIHVDDEGPGIPVADRTRVFEAYERLARDQASERTGTGLGLAIVRRIAEACGGRAWIETSPAGGARVTLELGASA